MSQLSTAGTSGPGLALGASDVEPLGIPLTTGAAAFADVAASVSNDLGGLAAAVAAAAGNAASASVTAAASAAMSAATSAATSVAAKEAAVIEARIRREFAVPLATDVPVMTRRILELTNTFMDPTAPRSLDVLQGVVAQTLQHVVGAEGAAVGVACAGALLQASVPSSAAWRGVKSAPLPHVSSVVDFVGAARALLATFPPPAEHAAVALEAIMDATARLVATAEQFPTATGTQKSLFVRGSLQTALALCPGWTTAATLASAFMLIDELSDAYKNKLGLQDLAVQATGALVSAAITSKCFGLCK